MKQQSPLLRIWELGEKEHGRLIGAIVLAAVGVIGGMVPYFAAAKMVALLMSGERDLSVYLIWGGAAMAGYAVKTLLYTFALSLSHAATFAVLKEIRQKILEKLPRLPLGTVIDTSSGKLKQIIVDQVDGMETTLAHLLPEMTSNLLGPVLILIYLFVLDWRMGLLSLISIPVGLLCVMSIMGSYEKDWNDAVRTTQEMNETIVEYIGGIEVIKAFNQGKNSYAKFRDRVLANASYYYQWMKRCQFQMSLGYAIAPATLITILPFGWIFYRNGSLSAEAFLTIIILSMGIVGPLLAAMSFVDSLAKVGTTVANVDGILKAEEQQHGEKPAELFGSEIVMEHVSFGYHEEKEILHDISLKIPMGTMTALVGPSGGGKSTIAKLIAGFWDVNQGKIMLGGVDEREIPLTQLYDQVAFVTQDNYLFDDTIRENIRMGRVEATDQEVETVAKAAGCDEFIRGLENGYDTRVGGGGAHLSGGERQRIAIARAMLKDAPIVILDEATAYMDPENETKVQRAVTKLVAGKTVIVIAHRLSTITGADQILLIQDGTLAASGTHEELLLKSALYKEMWQAHLGVKEENQTC